MLEQLVVYDLFHKSDDFIVVFLGNGVTICISIKTVLRSPRGCEPYSMISIPQAANFILKSHGRL